MMPGHGKSDRPIVPTKPPNEAEPEAKEVVEGRGLAKGNAPERNMSRTQSRMSMSSALERIRQAARRDRGQRFTALLHQVYDVEGLRAAYFGLKREAAPGIDGATWRQYQEGLERNLLALSERIKRERTERSLRVGLILPRRASHRSFVRSECSCWKTKLFSAPRPKCLVLFTNRTL